ncbi:MAG: Ig-like domain-containing protein [Treponema sp.]|nr:Ig-like domain-containing protein [Treponema sp.]
MKTIHIVFSNLLFIICYLLFAASACDILRNSPFEVTKWSPGEGYHTNPESLKVSLSFSHDPDRSSVEKNFSFSAEGESVPGLFLWKNKTLDYIPYIPLEINKDYSVTVLANAQSAKGLSMDWEFEGRFTTRYDLSRPGIVSFWPETDGIMDENRGNFVIRFSSPVSLISLRSNASFSPSASGAWHLEDEGKLAVFTPFDPWVQGKRFELQLSSSLTGVNGMSSGKDFFTVFTVGLNREQPHLKSVWRITGIGDQAELFAQTSGIFFENTGWEKEDKLRLVFSVPVDLLSVISAISAENGPTPVLGMFHGTGFSDDIVFRFDKAPVFESRFSINLKSGIKDWYGNESVDEYLFRIFANGEFSKPPSLAGIRIPMSPNGTPEDSGDFRLMAYGIDDIFADLPVESIHYPYGSSTATWIECYFESAPGASIDLFSIMELFRVETSNNVLLFSPVTVRSDSFSISEPHASWEQYVRIEIAGNITNTPNAGVVHFLVNRGLKDSFNNISENQFRISLLK